MRRINYNKFSYNNGMNTKVFNTIKLKQQIRQGMDINYWQIVGIKIVSLINICWIMFL